MVQYFPVVTGSLTVTGSINVSGGITASGGISISGSIASASFASTASFVALAQSASNAVAAATASFANAFTVAGNLTAQTLVVQTITSSVDYVTGSTRFGSLAANTHVFTGSMSVSGSGTFASSITAGDVITTSYGTARIQITSTTNSANSGLRFSAKDSTGTTKNAGLYYVAGTTTANTFTSIAADDNNYQFNVLANGNVGIGTSSPTNALHISGSGGNTQTLVLEGSPSAANAYVVVKSASKMYFSGLSSDQSNNFIIYDGTANTTRLAITSGGNVGIGTTTPNSILEISSATPIIRIQASDSGTFHGIEFRQAGGFDAFIKQLPVSGEFKISSGRSVGWGGFTTFYTDTVERMRITSGGKVGIGNSNPNNFVDIYGNGSNTSGILGVRTSGGGTFITGRIVSAETANQTLTIATCSSSGTNERIFLKIQVVNVSAVSNYGNVHVGYALWNSSGGVSVTTMTLDSGNSNIGNANVGSLSWSGNNLQYTTNRGGNYEMNHITIWACARDTGVVS